MPGRACAKAPRWEWTRLLWQQNNGRGGGAHEAEGRGPRMRGAWQGQTREALDQGGGGVPAARSPGKLGKQRWEDDAGGGVGDF